MKTFELIKKSFEEIVFSSREGLEDAWQEWKSGNEVILTWKVEDKIFSEVVTSMILEDIKARDILVYSVESK